MSNFLSIHDTHRLPYNNATITAKTVQSGDTTPIKFYSGHEPDSEDLGFEVFTNARGYLCDRSGNLYTDGVFVKEDAYITMTLGDGARTSWIVRANSDAVVNDGKLLGKIVDDRSQWEEGREYVQFGGHWRLVLHSANTPTDLKLPLADLADVPPINEWKESEQVTQIGPLSRNVTIEEYTKTLVLQWNGTKPETHEPVYVTVKTAVVNGRHRYAQHCLVYNQTDMRLTLVNESGSTIGNIAPTGSMNMGLFFLVDADTGEWIADNKLEDWDFGLDASNDGTSVEVSGAPSYGFYTVELNDRTPNILRIVAKNINFAGIQPYPREIPIKLVGNNLTKPRTIRIWFQNSSEGDGVSLPAVIYVTDANQSLCILYPASFCELFVGQGVFTVDNAPMVLDNEVKASPTFTAISTSGSARVSVPRRCDIVNIFNGVNGGVSELQFSTQDYCVTRFNVQNTSSQPVWFKLMNTHDQAVQMWAVCPANDFCNFTVRNSGGILYPIGDTETHPTSVVAATGNANWNATYGAMKGLCTTMVVNFAAINRQFGCTYGDHDDTSSFLFIDAPALLGVGQTIKFKVKVFGFTTTRGDHHPELFLGVKDGVNIRIELDYVYDGDSDNFDIQPVTYTYEMTRTADAAPSAITCTEFR
jgi:hypothetical protein